MACILRHLSSVCFLCISLLDLLDSFRFARGPGLLVSFDLPISNLLLVNLGFDVGIFLSEGCEFSVFYKQPQCISQITFDK